MLRTTVLMLLGVVLCAGCGRKQEGPDRFELSGTVTFDGKPVPIGTIRFSPDRDKGNSGPGASTTIRNGAYSTHTGQGVVAGPMIVQIVGIDDDTLDSDKSLFTDYRVELDIPKENSKFDFEVPPTAAAKARGKK